MRAVSPAIGLAIAWSLVAGCGSDEPVGTFCGNGRLDAGEACDDGKRNSDLAPGACRTNCASASCGDGVADPGEGCDDGAANSDRVAGACRSDCRPAHCGDGVVDPGEGCDEGAANGDDEGAVCRTTCALATCGDGRRNPGEACDDGGTNSDTVADACRTTCVAAGCGDGVRDRGEGCDEGVENHDGRPDACRTDCRAAGCGDGVRDAGEECDDGPENSDRYPGFCRTDCRLAHCGDGVLDEGERCDDGDENSDTIPDACRTDCGPARCGDGVQDAAEGCDLGDANDDESPDGCRTTCRLPGCGDGVLGGDEVCDDGAENSDLAPDACRTDCRPARCGDGVLDDGEGCDEGTRNDSWAANACRLTCRLPACGDWVVDAGESCDDGGFEEDSGCTETCAYDVPATCLAAGVPLADLRAVGTPDGTGYVVAGHLPAGAGLLDAGSCGGPSREDVYAFPVPAGGDLVVELEPSPSTPGFAPVLALRGACTGPLRPPLACAAAEDTSETVRLILEDVTPTTGMYYVQVDGGAGSSGDYTLRVHVRPTLGSGELCAPDGRLGRCTPHVLGCADPDADGLGSCVPLLESGTNCDATGAGGLCREPLVCRGGRCASSCGDGFLQPWEPCDDGNAEENDGCTSDCALGPHDCATPFDLNGAWDAGARRAEWSDDTSRLPNHLAGPCSSGWSGDAVASFLVPEDGRYAFGLSAQYALPALSLLDACASGATVLGCGEAGPGGQVRSIELTAGRVVYVAVDSRGAGGGPFTLVVERQVCGDGTVQGTETCDDGNVAAGDGCLPDCRPAGDDCPVAVPLPPPDASLSSVWTGALAAYDGDYRPPCGTATAVDAVASFTAPAAGRYSIRALAAAGSTTVFVHTGGCASGVVAGCAQGSYGQTAAVEATLGAGQTAWIVVGGSSTFAEFTLSVAPLVCGDGVRILPEECDDGNVLPGDGCGPTCLVETVPEAEPNDVRARAQLLPVGATLQGALGPYDLDYVAFDLLGGSSYEFETFLGGWETCVPGSGTSTALRLHGPAGDLLASDNRLGACSVLPFTAPATARYFLRIEGISGPLGIPSYLLRTGTVTP